MGTLPATRRPRRNGWFTAALLLAAFGLRIYGLGSHELWFDEALSAGISSQGWAGVLEHVRSSPFEHPPLYYLALHAWQRLAGDSEFALRYFSLFWGVLFVALLYALVRRLDAPPLARLAALLAAVSPFLVSYSQEARMYTLLPCLALLLLMSLYRALRAPDRPAWWLAYGALLVLGIATQYYFALLWIAALAYILVDWRLRRRASRLGAAVHLVALAGAAIWLLAAPGLRASLLRVAQGEAAFGLGYKLSKLLPALIVGEAGRGSPPLAAWLLAGGTWALALLGAAWSRRSGRLGRGAWGLLVAGSALPLGLALAFPYGVLGRHLGYTLAAVLPFTALGLLALRRRGPWALGAGVLLVVSASAYGILAEYTTGKGDLGEALAYVDRNGQPGDLLVLTQPANRALMDYYNRRAWPVLYLPGEGEELSAEQVDAALVTAADGHARVWLGPVGAWTADPQALVEGWLAANAFQAGKQWFSASSSAALYFMPAPLDPLPEGQGVEWEGRVRLVATQRSTAQVAPGGAVRLAFKWQALEAGRAPLLVSLWLEDGAGQVWAERRSPPCGGRCPTPDWQPGGFALDRHALLVPGGTPPGAYRLKVGWYAPEEGRALAPSSGQQGLDLGEVQVGRGPGAALPAPAEHPLRVQFGDELALLGYDGPAAGVRVGGVLALDLHWQALAAPREDYTLRWDLVDPRGQVRATWDRPPVSVLFPAGRARAGDALRGLQRLDLPSGLPPGRYRLWLSAYGAEGLLPARGSRPRQALGGLLRWQAAVDGTALELLWLRVSDRPRATAIPPVATSVSAQFGAQVELLGYDLDTAQAVPGGQLLLTLVWRARGATDSPHKVFAHLGDGVHPPLAQDDRSPGDGCCPTDTWAPGEVVVDRHTIPLPGDLAPGSYWLTVGLYDEGNGARLPVVRAVGLGAVGGQLFLAEVSVGPGSAVTPTPARPPMPFRTYLPLVERAP